MTTGPGVSRADAGFALVAVLWFLVAISAALVPLVVMSRTSAMIEANRGAAARLEALAGALLSTLAMRLSEPAFVANMTNLDGDAMRCDADGLAITIMVRDQGHLTDLNLADRDEFVPAFLSLGLGGDEAARLADTVAAFREPGAGSNKATRLVEVAGGLKHAPFEVVAELADFAPLEKIGLPKLAGVFTVHSRRAVASSAEGGPAAALSLRVGVGKGRQFGSAGFLLVATGSEAAPYRPVELLRYEEPASQPTASCPPTLQREIAATLADGTR